MILDDYAKHPENMRIELFCSNFRRSLFKSACGGNWHGKKIDARSNEATFDKYAVFTSLGKTGD